LLVAPFDTPSTYTVAPVGEDVMLSVPVVGTTVVVVVGRSVMPARTVVVWPATTVALVV
jgi:hypothetical protein